MLTSDEYANSEGILCPYCESNEVEATGSVQIDAGTGTQSVKCLTCNKSWTDILILVGYQGEK